LFPPDDERLSLETCRGGKINTLKKVKKSASSWLKTHNCHRMHGQQNIKKSFSIFIQTNEERYQYEITVPQRLMRILLPITYDWMNTTKQ
jgi:hypothetical protein